MACLVVDGYWVFKVLGRHPDYTQLREYLAKVAGEQIDLAWYFDAPSPGGAAASAFHALQQPYPKGPGFRVIQGWLARKTLRYPDGRPVPDPDTGEVIRLWSQKAVDTSLSHYTFKSFLNDRWRTLVLVGGDGDFLPLMRDLVLAEGVRLILAGWTGSMSSELMSLANRVVVLDDLAVRSAPLPKGRPA